MRFGTMPAPLPAVQPLSAAAALGQARAEKLTLERAADGSYVGVKWVARRGSFLIDCFSQIVSRSTESLPLYAPGEYATAEEAALERARRAEPRIPVDPTSGLHLLRGSGLSGFHCVVALGGHLCLVARRGGLMV